MQGLFQFADRGWFVRQNMEHDVLHTRFFISQYLIRNLGWCPGKRWVIEPYRQRYQLGVMNI